jgi:pantothenate kinase
MSTNTKAIVLFASALGVSILFLVRWRQKRELRRRHRRKSQGSLNIGGKLQIYMTAPFVSTDIIAHAASFPHPFFSHITGIFGCDFGGTLSKIVYFETKTAKNHDLKKEHGDTIEIPGRKSLRRNISLGQLDTPDHQVALDQLYSYMDSSRDTSGVSTRDDSLSFYSNILGGRLHFLHFETRNMASGIEMLSSTGITENIRTIGCTGGGAHKYAKEFEDQLGITFVQLDELGCLVRGMNFALTNVVGECYTYRNDSTSPVPVPDSASVSVTEKSPKKIIEEPKTDEKKIDKKSILEKKKIEINTEQKTPTPKRNEQNKDDFTQSDKMKTPQPQGWRRDVKEHTYKVTMPHEMFCTNELFPYLVVNIGSGVSILKVKSPVVFERVSGSSLGGGKLIFFIVIFSSKYCTKIDRMQRKNKLGVEVY